MFNVCLYPALVASHVSTKLINEKGLILLTGAAAPFLDTTPTMIAYNLAKVATHSIALNLSQSDIPNECSVVTILPKTIVTPMNLENMPDADHS
jgi:NAD(P)-dependent dehydrogenase (short-subunit alcohol dehydrogenase family)